MRAAQRTVQYDSSFPAGVDLSRFTVTGSEAPVVEGVSVLGLTGTGDLANNIREKEHSDIWVLDLARGTPSRLTFGGQNENPAWTPDGLHVVYSAKNKDGQTGVYSVPADGSGQPQ